MDGTIFEITDKDSIDYITDNINAIAFSKCEPSDNSTGWRFNLKWYNSEGTLTDEIVIMSENEIKYENNFYHSMRVDDDIDVTYFDMLLSDNSLVFGDAEQNISSMGLPVEAAYSSLLKGDFTILGEETVASVLRDTVFPSGDLEYTILDLDGDGISELLIQWVGDPCSYNGVFHFNGEKIICWNNDYLEGNCRDYPLKDGTMVRQYDFNGTRNYTLFQYQANGEIKELSRLFVRDELIPEDSTEPCPYYEIDGEIVSQADFDAKLNELIYDKVLERSEWVTF